MGVRRTAYIITGGTQWYSPHSRNLLLSDFSMGVIMVNNVRLTLTTLFGIIAGLCTWWWMGGIPAPEAWAVILSRALLGFAIGISAWRVNWAIHGIVLGILFSLPGAADAVWNHTGAAGFWGWIVSGLVIGFLIELFASPIFHHSGRRIGTTPQPHMP